MIANTTFQTKETRLLYGPLRCELGLGLGSGLGLGLGDEVAVRAFEG